MLIIFDCDGVLVDSEIIASEVNLELVKELGMEISLDELSLRFSGLTATAIFEQVALELARPLPDDIAERSDRMLDEALQQSLQAVSGVHDMLDALDGSRCICSNSTTARLEQNLKITNLYDRFQPHVFSAVEVRQKLPKPSPDVFLHAAETFGSAPQQTIVIEDSSHGVEGAVAAGMRVIGFTGASHSFAGHGERLMDAGAETTVSQLADVPATVQALRSWSGVGL
uniref:HAD family hydrolase n=1 Tax=Pararhizobium sp. IMCC3301 TaxID=3067904 RepID=UPI0027416B9B|nr:HAD-IA family hydrolase [Pararhizobium sp. IMCC3301]